MTTEEVIKYLNENRKEIFKVCEELNLRFPYENREELLNIYNELKSIRKSIMDEEDWKNNKDLKDSLLNLNKRIYKLEETYHILEPEFNEENEMRWIPKEFGKKAKEVYEFRKEISGTQSIYLDMFLTNLISQDMGYIWEEKGGQDEMYDAFPFTFTRRSIESSRKEYNEFLKEDIIFETEYIRSYALDGSGGIAIIERRTYSESKSKSRGIFNSCQQIVTLGEDDGYHFLNSATIYETNYGNREEFRELIDKVLIEYTNNGN